MSTSENLDELNDWIILGMLEDVDVMILVAEEGLGMSGFRDE